MKGILISLVLCCVYRKSLAQFSLDKVSNPDTVFSATWKTDLIKGGEWKQITDLTLISGRLYSTPNENIRGYDFKYFDSSVTIKPNPIDTIEKYSVKYLNGHNSFQLKLPLYSSEKKITYLLFNFKLCFLDSSYLLVERELQPVYLDLKAKNDLFRKKIIELNGRAFPSWALYSKKDMEILRKFILFKRVGQ